MADSLARLLDDFKLNADEAGQAQLVPLLEKLARDASAHVRGIHGDDRASIKVVVAPYLDAAVEYAAPKFGAALGPFLGQRFADFSRSLIDEAVEKLLAPPTPPETAGA